MQDNQITSYLVLSFYQIFEKLLKLVYQFAFKEPCFHSVNTKIEDDNLTLKIKIMNAFQLKIELNSFLIEIDVEEAIWLRLPRAFYVCSCQAASWSPTSLAKVAPSI